MSQLKELTTFNGEVFNKVQIQSKRQDGFSVEKSIYTNEERTKVAVVSNDVDVVLIIKSIDGSELIVDKP